MKYLKAVTRRLRWTRPPTTQYPETPYIATGGSPPSQLTPTQAMFVKWNAERLHLSLEESRARFLSSWTVFRDGLAGAEFRRFCMLSHRVFQVFVTDSEHEVIDAYRLHAPMHFLRMLSYPESRWDEQDIVVQRLGGRARVDILDYGCGLAQHSRGLAQYLLGRGIPTHLYLVDIETLRKEFLLWLAKQLDVETTFIASTVPARPIPSLPPSDICFAQEFFEHVYDPVRYLDAIHSSLKPRGILVTNVSDHHSEFMHVSPRLSEVRARLNSLGYEEVRPQVVYQKRG